MKISGLHNASVTYIWKLRIPDSVFVLPRACIRACVRPSVRVFVMKSYIIKLCAPQQTSHSYRALLDRRKLQMLHKRELFQIGSNLSFTCVTSPCCCVQVCVWMNSCIFVFIFFLGQCVSPVWDCVATPHTTAPCPGGSSSRVSSCPAKKNRDTFFKRTISSCGVFLFKTFLMTASKTKSSRRGGPARLAETSERLPPVSWSEITRQRGGLWVSPGRKPNFIW